MKKTEREKWCLKGCRQPLFWKQEWTETIVDDKSFRLFHCKRLKNSVQKLKEKAAVSKLLYVFGQYLEFGGEIKVSEINAAHYVAEITLTKLTRPKLTGILRIRVNFV